MFFIIIYKYVLKVLNILVHFWGEQKMNNFLK